MTISTTGPGTPPPAYPQPAGMPVLATAPGHATADALAAYRAEAADAAPPGGCGWRPRSDGIAGRQDAPSGGRPPDATREPSRATAVPCQVHGVDEFFKVVAKWSRQEPSVASVAQGIYLGDRLDAAAMDLLRRIVAEWQARGVLAPLMARVMARYERDGTLAATIDDLMSRDPRKDRAAAGQAARELLASWSDDPQAAKARFDLLLDPDSDIGDGADSDSGNAADTASARR
ncbi:hypothetical protein [Bordetella bronchialis]|uniref:Death domain-containing protein n=1 Tax=Bordetella bronchialis TaxID=463025 RepID=A0ABM6CPX6_9BORD|nr:hypothetical protein [Bordetella bronchialis]ANN65989.1 hypothetical protein BAU06_06485 [Bordetella bronchialis]